MPGTATRKPQNLRLDIAAVALRIPHHMHAVFLLAFGSFLTIPGFAGPPEGSPDKATDKPAAEEKSVKPVTRKATVTIDGKSVPYEVTAGKLQLETDDGKTRASVFHVSYVRTDVTETRPVMFAFNGGPGSSAVWLHLGVLGPKRVNFTGDGTVPPVPPANVVDNPESILDVCDLVFIDPVSTGYSRAGKDAKPAEFHGLNGDVESVGEFIRRWITEHRRWNSPKFILGESYGGVRAAGLASYLQSRHGMMLNGVVLLSSLLDFATLEGDLGQAVYLPSFTGVAHYHKKIGGNRDALVKECSAFAFGEYSSALLKGNALEPAAKTAVAAKLAKFTGIDAKIWEDRDLRISPTFFRAELLRKEGKIIGRFDARVAWDTTDRTAAAPDCDPSFELAYGAFATATLDYLGRELGYREDRPYEVMSGQIHQWQWDAENEIVDVSGRLGGAMRENPHLRVLVMAGYTDLATPPESVAQSVRQLNRLPAAALRNFRTVRYDGGHMFYLNGPDLKKTRGDLVEFLTATKP